MQGTDVNMKPKITVMMEWALRLKKRVTLYVQMVNAMKISMQKRMASLSKSLIANKCYDSYVFANGYANQYMKDLMDVPAKMDMRETSVNLKQEKVSLKRKRIIHQVVTSR